MVVEYSYNNSRFYKLLFYRSFGLIMLSIGLISVIGMALYSSKPVIEIVIAVIVFALLLGLVWTLGYFKYYKFIFAYKRINKNTRLMIDVDNLTIQSYSLNEGILSTKSNIILVILRSHAGNKLPFENPGNKIDKLENILYRNMNNNKKYSNIWYLELYTKDGTTYIMTPLMLEIREIPFKDVEVIYDEDFEMRFK